MFFQLFTEGHNQYSLYIHAHNLTLMKRWTLCINFIYGGKFRQFSWASTNIQIRCRQTMAKEPDLAYCLFLWSYFGTQPCLVVYILSLVSFSLKKWHIWVFLTDIWPTKLKIFIIGHFTEKVYWLVLCTLQKRLLKKSFLFFHMKFVLSPQCATAFEECYFLPIKEATKVPADKVSCFCFWFFPIIFPFSPIQPIKIVGNIH